MIVVPVILTGMSVILDVISAGIVILIVILAMIVVPVILTGMSVIPATITTIVRTVLAAKTRVIRMTILTVNIVRFAKNVLSVLAAESVTTSIRSKTDVRLI